MPLIDVIEEYLANAGYVEVEPGRWTPPDEDWVDKLIPTIADCLQREDDSL